MATYRPLIVNAAANQIQELASGDSLTGNGIIPVGGIIMWSGITVPTGWSLCNGSNGTPDLRNRFIVAADSLTKTGITTQFGTSPYDPGDVGGTADAVVVSHSHTTGDPDRYFATSQKPEGAGTTNILVSESFVGGNGSYVITTSNAYDVSGNVVIGESGTNKNLPPYYALAFIMRTL
jgi:hypothetical protein